MLKSIFFKFSVLVVGISLSLILLFKSSRLPNESKNGFKRSLLDVGLLPVKQIPTNTPVSKIIGATQESIFLSVPNPQWIIMTDTGFNKQDTLAFGLPLTKQLLSANHALVDSPNVHLFANNLPAYFTGRLNSWDIDTFALNTIAFSRADIVNKNKIVLRGLDSSLQKQTFKIVNLNTGKIEVEKDIIENQQPGGFECDGWLKFDNNTNCIYYVEYYRNRIYCLDTNLNILYLRNTIDTTKHNNTVIQIMNIEGDDRFMPTSPRMRVNNDCFINRDWLFVQSQMKADNETFEKFRENTVIDVYKLLDGKYLGSFYIPKINEQKIKSLYIKDRLLIVLSKKSISTFCLSLDEI